VTGTLSVAQAEPMAGAEPRWARWLTYFPFVAGGGLAALYVIGALTRTTQLMGADVTVRDTLPLVPLQQLLAVGIGAVVQSATYLPVVALFGLFALVSTARERRRLAEGDGEDPVPEIDAEALAGAAALRHAGHRDEAARVTLLALLRRTWKQSALGFALFALCMVLAYAPVTALTLVVLTAVLILVIVASPRVLALGHPWAFAAVVTGFVLTVTIVNAYIYPQPLARVIVARTAGQPDVRGGLVVDTGSTWYVCDARNHVIGIPASQVREVRTRSHGRKRPDALTVRLVRWLL
jgi:hypothetical protein